MKHTKVLFSIVFIGIALFSCKKEEAIERQADLKVFNFPINKCVATPDNGFLLSYWGYGAYDTQYPNMIAKVNSNGNLLWKKKMNLIGSDGDIIQLKDGTIASFHNVYDSMSSVTFQYYYHISFEKLDAQGNSLFTKKLFSPDSSAVSSPKIVELTSGDLMLVGGYLGSLYALHTDNNGNYVWGQSIYSSYYIYGVTKVIETDGNGDVMLIGPGNYSARIDASGTMLWEQVKPVGIFENTPTDIRKVNSNEYIITGHYDASLDALYNFQFFSDKINVAGDSVSRFVTGGSKQDYCLYSTMDQNNNLVMVGMEGRWLSTTDLNLASIKVLTVNSSLSSVVKNKTYAEGQDCSGLCAVYNSDGSLSIIGQKLAFGNANYRNTFFMKINPDGSL